MEVRELKYYKWVFNKDKITLVNKKENKSFTLSLAMADSFCRACISFKNKYRIEQSTKFRDHIKKVNEINREKIKILKEKINGSKTD